MAKEETIFKIVSFETLHPNITVNEIEDVLCKASCILYKKKTFNLCSRHQFDYDDIKYILKHWNDDRKENGKPS